MLDGLNIGLTTGFVVGLTFMFIGYLAKLVLAFFRFI